MPSTGCLGPTVNAVAMLEQMGDVAPDIRILLVFEPVSTVGTIIAQVGEIFHAVTQVQHGVWVLQEPHARLSSENDIPHGSHDAIRVAQIPYPHRLGWRILRARG